MIGLLFLGAALLWLALSGYLALQLPKWFGVSKPVARWLTSAAVFLILMIGPFVDHIVGMQQFQKLCDEQTGLQIYPNATNTKRSRDQSSVPRLLEGYAIPIRQRTDSTVDLGTNEVIAQYNHFSTLGGRVGGLVRLGGAYECAVFQSNHPEFNKYRGFKKQIEFTHGERK